MSELPDSAPVTHAQPGADTSSYMPQLDTLRTLAVVFVVLSHWFPDSAAQLGPAGVTIFFVLSGFLITRILLAGKDEVERGGSRRGVLGRFYARRTLRIFPVYYLTLACLCVAAIPGVREYLWWFLLYASNFLFYRIQHWLPQTSHFWTLAVEEQFYLLWPVLVLFTPRRHLLKLVAAAILAGPLSRIAMLQRWDGSPLGLDMVGVLMPTCMDALGLGALRACQRARAGAGFVFRSGPWRVLLALCLIFVFWRGEWLGVVLGMTATALLALELISRASIGFSGPARTVMENPVLVYLGRISYGLYLFHLAVPHLYAWAGLPALANPLLRFAVQFSLLVALASASWYLFEKPILSLKRYFPARTKGPGRVEMPA